VSGIFFDAVDEELTHRNVFTADVCAEVVVSADFGVGGGLFLFEPVEGVDQDGVVGVGRNFTEVECGVQAPVDRRFGFAVRDPVPPVSLHVDHVSDQPEQ
jgi:hypothetical protein